MIYACFVYHFSGIRSHNKRTYSPVKLSLFPVNPSNAEATEATQFKLKRDIGAQYGTAEAEIAVGRHDTHNILQTES